MTMRHCRLVVALLLCGGVHGLAAQQRSPTPWTQGIPHYGKWVTALSTVAFTVMAQREHNQSQQAWNALLDICRSTQDACALGSDGRYLRSDAEQLYQRSRAFDRRANHWLFGAEASLLVTAGFFIIDLHPGEGPENIPYPPVNVGLRIPL